MMSEGATFVVPTRVILCWPFCGDCGDIGHLAADCLRSCACVPATCALQERDASVQRVLWVDVLNLLALEGAHGERVRAALDASGGWGGGSGTGAGWRAAQRRRAGMQLG